MKIALQMYTLREECAVDFFETLAKVAELGFKGVEFAGFFNYSAQEVRQQLDQLGLVAVGSHTPIEALEKDLDAIIEYNKIIGNQFIICPYSKWEDRKGLEDIATLLNKASKTIKENGLTLLYHNHSHEFDLIDDQYGLDLLYALTKDNGVGMELDTHWLTRVGVDVTAYMEEYGKRCQLVHLKDLQIVDGEMTFAALGEGIMNIEAIIHTAGQIGLEWVIVENDQPKPNGLENVTQSMNYLKALQV